MLSPKKKNFVFKNWPKVIMIFWGKFEGLRPATLHYWAAPCTPNPVGAECLTAVVLAHPSPAISPFLKALFAWIFVHLRSRCAFSGLRCVCEYARSLSLTTPTSAPSNQIPVPGSRHYSCALIMCVFLFVCAIYARVKMSN
jgi:hypothetical protein